MRSKYLKDFNKDSSKPTWQGMHNNTLNSYMYTLKSIDVFVA